MFMRQFKWGVFLLKNNKGLQKVNNSQPGTECITEKYMLAWLKVWWDDQGQIVGFTDPLISILFVSDNKLSYCRDNSVIFS